MGGADGGEPDITAAAWGNLVFLPAIVGDLRSRRSGSRAPGSTTRRPSADPSAAPDDVLARFANGARARRPRISYDPGLRVQPRPTGLWSDGRRVAGRAEQPRRAATDDGRLTGGRRWQRWW